MSLNIKFVLGSMSSAAAVAMFRDETCSHITRLIASAVADGERAITQKQHRHVDGRLSALRTVQDFLSDISIVP